MSILNNYKLKKEEVNAFWNDFTDILPEGIEVFTQNHYDELKSKLTSECKLILVSAELNIGGASLYNYQGLELIRQIRLENIGLPIILCSPQPKEEIIDKYDLLKTKGCYFLRLEQTPVYPDTKNLEPLSQMYLEDIKYSFLDLIGALRSIKHDLSTDLTNNVSIEEAINLAKEKIAKLFDNASEIPSNLWSDLSNCLKELKNLGDSTGLLDKFLTDIFGYLHLDEDDSTSETKTIKTDKTPWTVLYVEDSEEHRKLVKTLFEHMGIRCIAVSDSKGCFEELDKQREQEELVVEIDTLKKEKTKLEKQIDAQKKVKDHLITNAKDNLENIEDISKKIEEKGKKIEKIYPITLIVTDWRLKQANDEWQEKQGYEILDDIAKGNYNIPTFVMITNRRDTIIRSARSIMPYKVKWYYKTSIFYNDYEKQLFAEDIFSMGNEAWEIVNGLKCLMFENKKDNEYSFKEMYIHFLRQEDYESINKQISKTAFQYYLYGILINENIRDWEEYKNYIESDIKIEGGLNAKFYKNNSKDVKLSALYAKLVARLQFIALYQKYGLGTDQCITVVFKKIPPENFEVRINYKNEIKTLRTVLSNSLMLPTKPKDEDLLYFEKKWLNNLVQFKTESEKGDTVNLIDDYYSKLLKNKINYEMFLNKAKELLLINPFLS